jgi:hypothetical protein
MPASTPGQEVTSSVIRSLAVRVSLMPAWCTLKRT